MPRCGSKGASRSFHTPEHAASDPVAAALSFTLMAAILAMVFLYVRRFGTEELV